MAVNGKRKGNKNERNLCKWWTTWSGLEFSRVPASGGLRWQKKDDITGDIICTDSKYSRRFPFSIEAKAYKDIRFEHLILGNTRIKIIEFWEQAKEDGIRGGKQPILFMRYNGMPASTWFVIINEEVHKLWEQGQTKEFTHKPMVNIKLEDGEVIYILNSDDFCKIEYKSFITKLKKLNRNGK